MRATDRSNYRHDSLVRVLNPRSIAIAGASPRPGSFGKRVLENLRDFSGEICLVNPKYDAIDSRQCFKSLSTLPGSPDCVVIVAPREGVEDLVREAAEIAAGGVIIFASGYSETGDPRRVALQDRLASIARQTGLRIVGPNCIGIMNTTSAMRISFIDAPSVAVRGVHQIGIVSQSGALGFGLAQALHRGVPISHVLTSGNGCDVDLGDYIAYLAQEPRCRAIACLFEGTSSPGRLIWAAQHAAAANKPLVIYKIATGKQGAEAAMSHTGSLAGSQEGYRAAFRRAGAVMVDDLEALIETAGFFAKAGKPTAPGVAVIATSGGAAIIAADKAELYGVPLPQPLPHTQAVLESHVPDFGSTRNPCDVTAQVVNDLSSLPACAGALLNDRNYGTLLFPYPYAYEEARPRIEVLSELAAKSGKPVCVVWTNEWLEGPGALTIEEQPNLVLFRSMDRCFRTLAAWHERSIRLDRKSGEASPISQAARDTVTTELIRKGDRMLTEREAKELLALYGIPVVRERLALSPEAAVIAASKIGYPVVLKLESPDVPHKSDAGVIILNLSDAVAVRNAYSLIMEKTAALMPMPCVNGILVQRMAPAGVEVMIGARIDPLFGPMVVVGLGGIFVEILKDVAVALAPVTPLEAREMLDSLKGKPLLHGARGTEPVDLELLSDIVSRVSSFIADQQDGLREIDINPFICAGSNIMAVDALIV